MDRLSSPVKLSVKGETEMECLKKIQAVHGMNYQVVETKDIKIKTGFLGLFYKNGIELFYLPTRSQYSGFSGISRSTVNSSATSRSMDFNEEKNKILEKNNYRPNPQMQEVLETVKSLQQQISSSKNFAPEEHPTISKIESLLENNEFSSSYIRRIVDKIRKEFPLETLDDFDAVQNSVVEWIGESISIKKPVYESRPQVIILVGPTGVGKTTTVAKLAARYSFGSSGNELRKNVRIITIDWYRIGAREQIEIYGETMQVPVSKAESSNDIGKLLDTYRNDEDYIIIDTAGYSPKDYENIAKMKKVLDVRNYSVETYLCMSASTKLSDMKDIMQQYEIFGYDSVIITKFDETSYVGNVVCALSDRGKNLTYLTTGQKVPNYFEEATQIRLLTELSGFNIDRKNLEKKFGILTD